MKLLQLTGLGTYTNPFMRQGNYEVVVRLGNVIAVSDAQADTLLPMMVGTVPYWTDVSENDPTPTPLYDFSGMGDGTPQNTVLVSAVTDDDAIATPASGKLIVFGKPDGTLRTKDHAGDVHEIAGGGGGGEPVKQCLVFSTPPGVPMVVNATLLKYIIPFDFNLVEVQAYLGTPVPGDGAAPAQIDVYYDNNPAVSRFEFQPGEDYFAHDAIVPVLVKGHQFSIICANNDRGADLYVTLIGNTSDSGEGGGGTLESIPVSLPLAISDEVTPLVANTGTPALTFHAPFDMDLTGAFVGLSTPDATGSDVQVSLTDSDLTPVLGETINIVAGDDTGTWTPAGPASLTKGTRYHVFINQVGDGAAAGLKLYLEGTRDAA